MASTSSRKDPLQRLIERQEEELEAIETKISTWKKYREDYAQLDKVINDLSGKVRHKFNIPIGGTQKAFIPGHIIHTNELHVLLGDNLFALRSTKQASEIIKRRITNVEKMLSGTENNKKQTEEWLKAAQGYKHDKEEFVEIIETM